MTKQIDHSNNTNELKLPVDTELLALCNDSIQHVDLQNLTNLIELNLANNKKIKLANSFIPSTVSRIDATNCNLQLDLRNVTSLRKLYISLNGNVTFKEGYLPYQTMYFWTPNQKKFHQFIKECQIRQKIDFIQKQIKSLK